MSGISLIIAELLFLTSSVVDGQLLGGRTPHNPNDLELMDKAWKATTTLNNAASNAGPYLMVPIKVVKAETQVVAGLNYFLEVVFGESTCKKGHVALTAVTKANCPLRANGNRALYEVDIYERAWENFQKFTISKVRNLSAGEESELHN